MLSGCYPNYILVCDRCKLYAGILYRHFDTHGRPLWVCDECHERLLRGERQ